MTGKEGWRPGEMEITHRIGLVFAKRPWPGFEWAVQEYRQIELDTLANNVLDEFLKLEFKRRIAEWILMCADRDNVPFERFQEAWNELHALGFSDEERKLMMSHLYADYCAYNGQYDAGLAVAEPAIAAYEQWLQSATLRPKIRKYHEEMLGHSKHTRDGLLALKAGGAEAEAWLKLDEARGPTPEQERKSDLEHELYKKMKKIRDEGADLGFPEIEKHYRQLETEFLAALLPTDEAMVLETKRGIASALLDEAQKHSQPFEVVQALWKETRDLGFGSPEGEALNTRPYIEYCLRQGQVDEALAVVEPLLASWQKQIEEDTAEDMTSDYKREIERMQKLREELVALKTTTP